MQSLISGYDVVDHMVPFQFSGIQGFFKYILSSYSFGSYFNQDPLGATGMLLKPLHLGTIDQS